MKFFKKLLVTTLVVSASLMQAQFVGGGSEENLRNVKTVDDSPWRNRFYLYGGPSIPMGAWGQEVGEDATLSAMYSNNAGFGAKRGWYAEMGSMFYLKKLALPEQMGIAINLTYFQVSVNKYTPFNTPVSSSRLPMNNFFFLSSKLGATYTYSLFEGLCADAYFNICPGIQSVPDMDSESTTKTYNYDYKVIANSSFASRKNFGLAVRYKALTVGLDFMVGKFNLTKEIQIIDQRTNQYVLNETTITKFRANSAQIRLGFTL